MGWMDWTKSQSLVRRELRKYARGRFTRTKSLQKSSALRLHRSRILQGEKSARRDIVLMNAAAALIVAGKAEHLSAAVPIAKHSIDSGAAAAKLDALVRFTQADC